MLLTFKSYFTDKILIYAEDEKIFSVYLRQIDDLTFRYAGTLECCTSTALLRQERAEIAVFLLLKSSDLSQLLLFKKAFFFLFSSQLFTNHYDVLLLMLLLRSQHCYVVSGRHEQKQLKNLSYHIWP